MRKNSPVAFAFQNFKDLQVSLYKYLLRQYNNERCWHWRITQNVATIILKMGRVLPVRDRVWSSRPSEATQSLPGLECSRRFSRPHCFCQTSRYLACKWIKCFRWELCKGIWTILWLSLKNGCIQLYPYHNGDWSTGSSERGSSQLYSAQLVARRKAGCGKSLLF